VQNIGRNFKLNASDLAKILVEKTFIIDEEIAKVIPKTVKIPNLNDAVWYILTSGGKRLRPAIGLLVSESLGGNQKQALRFGVAVELVHTFLLIHDDIEDGDLVRRNKATLWAKYGLAHGVNTGDFVMAKVMETVGSLRQLDLEDKKVLDLYELVANCLIETGKGQTMDINARNRNDLTESEYLEIVQKKTGAYLTLPITGAAIISGADIDVLDAIEQYGTFVGPAFQIEDDVIDLTEGKGRGEKGCDIKEGKRSYIVIYTTTKCTEQEKIKLFSILNKSRESKSEEEITWVMNLFKKYGAVNTAKKKAMTLAKQGKEKISAVPAKLKDVLIAFADFSVLRNK
jgi:geranylgeranyl pyrophosphate synthase